LFWLNFLANFENFALLIFTMLFLLFYYTPILKILLKNFENFVEIIINLLQNDFNVCLAT